MTQARGKKTAKGGLNAQDVKYLKQTLSELPNRPIADQEAHIEVDRLLQFAYHQNPYLRMFTKVLWSGYAMSRGQVLAVELVEAPDVLRVGRLEVGHTPRQSPGSVSFHAPELSVLFSGDTLVAGSIGRTDLWGGDHEQELASIRDRLFTLDPDTVVHPGHGPETRIREEKEQNPFLR